MDGRQILDELHERYGWTDYRIAKNVGLTRSRISQIRHLQTGFSETTAEKIAKLLDKDPAYVFAVARAACAKRTEEREFWGRLAKKLMAWIACISGALGAYLAPSPVQAAEFIKALHCILCKVAANARRGKVTGHHAATP